MLSFVLNIIDDAEASSINSKTNFITNSKNAKIHKFWAILYIKILKLICLSDIVHNFSNLGHFWPSRMIGMGWSRNNGGCLNSIKFLLDRTILSQHIGLFACLHTYKQPELNRHGCLQSVCVYDMSAILWIRVVCVCSVYAFFENAVVCVWCVSALFSNGIVCVCDVSALRNYTYVCVCSVSALKKVQLAIYCGNMMWH